MNLTAEEIRKHVGSTSFMRGKDYFTKGNVRDIVIDETTLIGLVQGTEKKPYEVEVEVGNGKIIDSDCSCPVGFACKHVAALCFKALLMLVKSLDSKKATQSIQLQLGLTEDWRKKLSGLIGAASMEPAQQFQLQLLLKIEQKSQRFQPAFAEPEFSLRPRIYDPKTGKFSASEITWQSGWYGSNSVYWNGQHGKVMPEQFIYLQLLARVFSHGYQTGWMSVPEDEGKAAYVWKMLQKADEFGVTLFGGQKGQTHVVFSNEPIVFSLELRESGNNLQLSRKILFQANDVSGSKIAFIGDPPVFAVWETAESYSLHAVSGAGSMKMIKGLNKPLLIPKKDSHLLEQFLPELTRQYHIGVKTKMITIPEVVLPQPVISMKLERKMRVKVSFGLFYENTYLPFINPPQTLTVDKKTVSLNQQKISEIKNILEQSLADFSQVHQYPVSFMLAGGIVLDGIDVAKFSAEVVPELQKRLPDLIVQTANDLPNFTFDGSMPEIAINIGENESENDWFDLSVTVSVGNEKVPFYQLFNALAEKQEYLLLETGRYFSLQIPQFDKLRQLIAETKLIRENEGNKLQISRFQAGLWEELQKLGIVKKQAEKWQQTMEKLLGVKKVDLAKIDSRLQAVLRPYQHEGYSLLKFWRDYNLGGILADDMGLGKTIQTINLIIAIQAGKKKKTPFLVVAPTSVVENWDNELEHFAPFLKKVILRAGDRTLHYRSISRADVVVISYALLVRDFDKIKTYQFDTLILDEAQMVKNYQSKAYSLIRQLKTESKIALTGTPLENNLMELWSIFSIVAPGLFAEPKKFQEMYRIPIEKYQDVQVLNRLRSRIRPFMLRRQKSLVEKQLPAKNEQVVYLNLNEKHRHLYDLQLQHERKRVLGLLQNGGLNDHRFEILRSLMKMRQMCLHPQLVDKKHSNIPATKIEALKDYIGEIVAEDHRILIFSQFTTFLAKVKEVLQQINIDYLYLDGQTQNRGELVKKFQQGNIPVFVISLKSGGFGLNLTAADYCILLDPWWNPAVEQQAIDRTHRIGQTKPVFVYKMIAKDTIEEKVLQLQQKKQKLFKNILEDDNLFGSVITEQDIQSLFSV